MAPLRSGRFLCVVALALLAFLLLASPVAADKVYHTSQIALQPVDNAPLKSGQVVNIHTNGVHNYAHEIYRLTGAQPDTTYQMVLVAYLGSSNCTGASAEIPSATLTTNVSGNGESDFFLSKAEADAMGIHGLSVSAKWEVRLGTTAMYRTACEAITLD